MRPIFGTADNGVVNTDYGSIPFDAENMQPVDYLGEAGRLYQQALTENEMAEPDPYVAPEPAPFVPTPEQQVMFDHENRIRAFEGTPPLSLDDFLAKAFRPA